MDRRQKKTQKAIFLAFTQLLEEKRYVVLTASDIIERADIGRSTFYMHFATKEHVLRALCQHIAEHIFWATATESKASSAAAKVEDMHTRIVYIFRRAQEKSAEIHGIVSSEGEEVFTSSFKEYLYALFAECKVSMPKNVPSDYGKQHFAQSFCSALKWWITTSPQYSAEEMAGFFMSVMLLKQSAVALKLL